MLRNNIRGCNLMYNLNYSAKEFYNILNSYSPSLDLHVNKKGRIAKRNIVSKLLYYFGYKAKESDSKVKQRVEEIVDQLMAETKEEGTNPLKGVKRKKQDKKAEMGRFLEKIGNLKLSQFDRNTFQTVLNPKERKKIVNDLKIFSNTIGKQNSCMKIKEEAAKLYEQIIAQVISGKDERLQKELQPMLQEKVDRLKGFHNFNPVELRKQVKKDLEDAISKIEPPKGTLANSIEEKFRLREKNHFKQLSVELLIKTSKLEDADKITKLIHHHYCIMEKELGTLLAKRHDPDLEALKKSYLRKKEALSKLNNPTKEQLLDIVKSDVLETKTLSKIAKMNLLFHLGVHGSSNKGATGTVLIKDLKGRILGVFKPDSVYAPMATKIHNAFKKIGGQLSLLSNKKLAQPTAEYVAYRLDRFFNLKSVPSSKITDLGSSKGVFQLAASTAKKTRDLEVEPSPKIGKRLKEAKDVTTILNKNSFTSPELELFQRFAIHDFLIGNLDAHAENWFIDLKGDEITGIIGIDKANSWLKKNPRSGDFRSHNQYKWGEFNIANQPFTDSMRTLMRTITDDQLIAFINEMNLDCPRFFDKKIRSLALQRAQAIRIIANKANSTPADLGKITSDRDFQKVFQPKTSK
jgi:hypothetical protein